VDRLREQTQMRADRNILPGKCTNNLCSLPAALKFNHLRAPLAYQSGGTFDRLHGVGIRQVRQIHGQDGSLETPARAAGVIDHLIECYRQGGWVPLNNHTERVAHQYQIDASFIHCRGKGGIVGSEGCDFYAARFHGPQFGHRQRFRMFSHRQSHQDPSAGRR
jgi:hypothetical protein